MARRFSLQVPMGSEPGPSEGKIRVDEHYPSEADDGPPIDVKKIESIRSNVKFDQCYEISKHIGDGKFGKVFHVKDKTSGLEYAAKFIKIRKEADRADVEREVSILTSLRHPRIAQIYDAFYTTTNEVVLIMEIVRGGELFDRVADENYVLTEQAVAMIICQLCEAISYIHQQRILHLDVKPENIMCVTQKGNRIKLIDFGLARYYDGTQELKYMAGTPEFAAPEVIKYENLTYYTDMWSVGVIAYILLSGYSPFLGDNLGETYCNVEKGVWEFTEEFDTVSPEAKDFISKLLVYEQKKRMLPDECLTHPWIAQQRAKAMVDANLEKPAEGAPIDNRQMRGYNAKRKFRRMVIYVKFLIEMNRLRNSLRDRRSENAQKFFDPLLKMAEEKEKKLATVANALSAKPKPALGTLVEASLSKKRASLPSSAEEPVPKTEKPTKTTTTTAELPPAGTKATGEKVMVKTVTKTIVDPVTGETKTVIVKKKSVKKTSPDGEKKPSIKRKGNEKEKKEEPSTTTDRPQTESAAPAEAPKKKKASIPFESPTPAGLPPLPPQDTLKRKSLATHKTLATTDSTSSSPSSLSPAPQATKKKSVVLDGPPALPKPSEAKFNSLLDMLKKRRSLPAKLPSVEEQNAEAAKSKKQSLVTTTASLTKDLLPPKPLEAPKTAEVEKPKKSLVSAELPPVQLKIVDAKEKAISTLTEVPKKRKTVVVLAKVDHPDTPPKTPDTLTLPRIEKKTQKSDSSDSTKENRSEQEVKKPSRQGALKKKEKLDDSVLNIVSARKSLDSSITLSKKEDADKIGESILMRKKLSLRSTGEKDLIQDTKAEVKKEDTGRESLIKAKLSKLNNEGAPLTMNIMSVAQKTHIEEKKPNVVISMIPEKTTTTTTSTTTSVRRKASTTEKKVQLTSQGKTVEQVELTNSTHDKVKVSQITTKKEESPELETPLTSVKKKIVKQNTLKSQSEKNRKEEEKTTEGSLVQVTKVLNDKTLNQVAVNEHTTLPNGATKRISLSTTSELSKKIEGKAEAEITPKRLSLKKAELNLTEKTRSSLGSDINGNKTMLQKAHKTEIKITPSTPTTDEIIKLEFPKEPMIATSQKRGSILVVPKLKSRENSEEHKTVRFSKDVRDTSSAGPKAPFNLLKMNSESCLNKKIQAAVKVEETLSRDDGDLKKKKKTLLASKSQDVYVPKEDFSFNSLKEKLLRRVSATEADLKTDVPKEVLVSKTHSVKDRLRQFENKRL